MKQSNERWASPRAFRHASSIIKHHLKIRQASSRAGKVKTANTTHHPPPTLPRPPTFGPGSQANAQADELAKQLAMNGDGYISDEANHIEFCSPSEPTYVIALRSCLENSMAQLQDYKKQATETRTQKTMSTYVHNLGYGYACVYMYFLYYHIICVWRLWGGFKNINTKPLFCHNRLLLSLTGLTPA